MPVHLRTRVLLQNVAEDLCSLWFHRPIAKLFDCVDTLNKGLHDFRFDEVSKSLMRYLIARVLISKLRNSCKVHFMTRTSTEVLGWLACWSPVHCSFQKAESSVFFLIVDTCHEEFFYLLHVLYTVKVDTQVCINLFGFEVAIFRTFLQQHSNYQKYQLQM